MSDFSVHPGVRQAPYSPDPSNPYGVTPLGFEIDQIEEGFWQATPELALICATANNRVVGRWGLLGAVLVSALSWIPPQVVLTDRYGNAGNIASGGSLNFFAHLVGESGVGKTRVANIASELVPPRTNRNGGVPGIAPDLIPDGTGEGLIKHFVALETETDPSRWRPRPTPRLKSKHRR